MKKFRITTSDKRTWILDSHHHLISEDELYLEDNHGKKWGFLSLAPPVLGQVVKGKEVVTPAILFIRSEDILKKLENKKAINHRIVICEVPIYQSFLARKTTTRKLVEMGRGTEFHSPEDYDITPVIIDIN